MENVEALEVGTEEKKRRTMSPEGRARVAEAQRLRWAKRRADIDAGVIPSKVKKVKKAKTEKAKDKTQVVLVSNDGQVTVADLTSALEDFRKAREAFTRLVNRYVNG